MKISRGKIYKVLLSRNQTKKKKHKKHLHKRKHKNRRTYHKRKRPHLRNKSLKNNKRHKRHRGGSRIVGDKNVKKKMQASDNRYQELWEDSTQKYIKDIEGNKGFKRAKTRYNAMKSNLQYRSNFRILGDGLSALFTKKTTDSTTAKQSIHDQIEEFLKVEKLLDMNETELKQNLTNVQQRLNTLLEDNIEEYTDVKSAFSELGVGVGMVPAIDLALLRLEKKFSTSFEMLTEKINNWKNKTNRSETALNQIKEGILQTSTLANQISKLMAFLGVPETGNNYGVLQTQKNSMAGFLSQADNNEVWNNYTSRLRRELENIMTEMIDKYKELLGSFISAGMAEQQGKLTTRPPSEYYVFWTELSKNDNQLLNKQIVAENVSSDSTTNTSDGVEMDVINSANPIESNPSESDASKTDSVDNSNKTDKSTSSSVESTQPAQQNVSGEQEQGIEMQSSANKKKCNMYTPEKSDSQSIKANMKERCNKNENCTFDDDSNTCKNKEVPSAADAIPVGENIPDATGSQGATQIRCDGETWPNVKQFIKPDNTSVIALCKAGIKETTINGIKVPVPTLIKEGDKKGYTKIETVGDGDCGWYAILEYIHRYGSELVSGINPNSEIGKIIRSVMGLKGDGLVQPKRQVSTSGLGGVKFDKQIVRMLRNFARSFQGAAPISDEWLNDVDMPHIARGLGVTLCLYESQSQQPAWRYYNNAEKKPGIVGNKPDNPIPLMLYHNGGSRRAAGTIDYSSPRGGHFSLIIVEDDSPVFNKFEDVKQFNRYKAIEDQGMTTAVKDQFDCQYFKKEKEQATANGSAIYDMFFLGNCGKPKGAFIDYFSKLGVEYKQDIKYDDLKSKLGELKKQKKSGNISACNEEVLDALDSKANFDRYLVIYKKCKDNLDQVQATTSSETDAEASADSVNSDCQSQGSCNYNREFIDYYKTLSIKRPSEWSKEYAKAVDLAYEKAKQAEDVFLSGGPTHDTRGYKITSTKFSCETEAFGILSNSDSWAKYDSTYEKCGGKEKADWKLEDLPKQQTTSSPAANVIPQGENIPPSTGDQEQQTTVADTNAIQQKSEQQEQEQQQEQQQEQEQEQPQMPQEESQQEQAPQQQQAVAAPKPQSGTISTTHVDVKPSGELVVTIKAVLPKGSLMNVTGPGGSDTTAVIRGLVNHINENSSGSTPTVPDNEPEPETSQDEGSNNEEPVQEPPSPPENNDEGSNNEEPVQEPPSPPENNDEGSDEPDCGPGTGNKDNCEGIQGCHYTKDKECLPVTHPIAMAENKEKHQEIGKKVAEDAANKAKAPILPGPGPPPLSDAQLQKSLELPTPSAPKVETNNNNNDNVPDLESGNAQLNRYDRTTGNELDPSKFNKQAEELVGGKKKKKKQTKKRKHKRKRRQTKRK